MKPKNYLIPSIIVAGIFFAAYLFGEFSNAPPGQSPTNQLSTLKSIAPSQAPEFSSLEKVQTRLNSRSAYVLEESSQPPPGNALGVIQALKPLADKGDGKAALSIYLKLSSCQSLLDSLPDKKVLEAYRKAGADAALAETTERIASECEDLDERVLSGRGFWLENAAKSGVVEAQILYSTDSMAILGNSSDMLRNPKKVEEYKSNAIKFLTDAALGGNIDALLRLGNAYDKGILVQNDPARAYAYYRAAQLARPDLVTGSLPEAIRRGVPQEQMAHAEQLAKLIARNCCGN